MNNNIKLHSKNSMGSNSKVATEKDNYLEVNYANKKLTTAYDFKLLAYIMELGEIEKKGSALDLACGTGSFKPVFECLNFNYCGVDIDNEDSTKNIFRCDIANSELPFSEKSFDVVFFKMGIEHLTIKEISHCLQEVKRVLKKNGRLIVITPDWDWTYRTFFEEYTHQTPFMKKSLNTALQMAGYECDFCKTIIQIPVVWRFPFLKYLCDLACMLYPVAKNLSKYIRYSKERPLLAIARKKF